MAEKQELRFRLRKPADEAQKIRAVHACIADHPDLFGVICCSVPAKAENVFFYLKNRGIAAACELPSGREGGGVQAFRDGEAKVLIVLSGSVPADLRPDVRYVLHYNLPFSLEDYTRDVSCAGADGKGAECILYYLQKDRKFAENYFRKLSLEGRTEEEKERAKARKESYAALTRLCGLPSEAAAEALRAEVQKTKQPKPGSGKKKLPKADKPDSVKKKPAGKVVRRPADTALCVNGSAAAQKIRAGEDKNLTYFDSIVADAAYTLMRQQVKMIYAKHIMELLSGNSSLTLRPEKKEEVESSLRKVLAAQLLPLKEESDGFSYAGQLPPFYTEAEKRHQIRTIPAEMLHVAKLPTSRENLSLTHYLYLRAEAGKEKTEIADLWKALQISFPEGLWYRRRKETTILEKAGQILGHFREKKLIKDFDITEKEIVLQF